MPKGHSDYHRSFHARSDEMLAAFEAEGDARRSTKQLAEEHGITANRVTQLLAAARQRRTERERQAGATEEAA